MRKAILLILATPLILIFIGVLFILPAHQQIRSIHPPLPSFDAIADAVGVSGDGPTAIYYLNSASQRSPMGVLGHAGILIEWADGRSFLIDAGMSGQQAISFGKPMEFILDAEPTETFGSLADQLGQSVDSVEGIAFTHLHSDHTGGLPFICDAQMKPATVFQAPLQFSVLNYTTEMGFEAFENMACQRRQLGEEIIKTLPGFPGLVAISLGGHTPGSTLYAARVDGTLWLLSGDITNNKESLLLDRPKPWIYSAFIVPEDTKRTARLRDYLLELDRREGVTVLPAHDVVVMAENISRFPAP